MMVLLWHSNAMISVHSSLAAHLLFGFSPYFLPLSLQTHINKANQEYLVTFAAPLRFLRLLVALQNPQQLTGSTVRSCRTMIRGQHFTSGEVTNPL
jgi:hypothetical protein